ncbi:MULTISPECIES: DUF4440 domain-containing protein [Arthrobacter]|uniref:DUF4440 domain-containing protein n=2 Tax=Arthrobacter TaxID=1663 RepID=A0ABU9KHE3_9MICC|nr:DUF4440 domain-containing protein [Arthrobacter sp. YJM1]MDP5226669.1 DUF4440 domain-containing protein [Arthrobacter sp. YJM1]
MSSSNAVISAGTTYSSDPEDLQAVTDLLHRFFSAFVSGPGAVTGGEVLREVLLPGAVIVSTCGAPEPRVHSVEEFIRPRVELLSGGRLQDFREWPTEWRIELFGDVAQIWCGYAKSWSEAGEPHTGRGMKSSQLVRTAAGWRFSAIAWDDERPGVPMS